MQQGSKSAFQIYFSAAESYSKDGPWAMVLSYVSYLALEPHSQARSED